MNYKKIIPNIAWYPMFDIQTSSYTSNIINEILRTLFMTDVEYRIFVFVVVFSRHSWKNKTNVITSTWHSIATADISFRHCWRRPDGQILGKFFEDVLLEWKWFTDFALEIHTSPQKNKAANIKHLILRWDVWNY